MKTKIVVSAFGVFMLLISFCSKAPQVIFPEPTDRFVLAELATDDA